MHKGHNITVLINRADAVDYAALTVRSFAEWRELIFRRDGIRIVHVDSPPGLDKVRDRCGFACVWSYTAYQWLAARDGQFDIIHFHDNAAFGYFTFLAKQQRRHFANTLLVLGAHGPHFWERKANRVYLSETYNLEADYMERKGAEWADWLIAPSNFIVDWMLRQGWRLPPRSRVRISQNIMPVSQEVLDRRWAEAKRRYNDTDNDLNSEASTAQVTFFYECF